MTELLTFGILFLSYVFARSPNVAMFNESQLTLDLNAGALNTVLLITESCCVAPTQYVRCGPGRSKSGGSTMAVDGPRLWLRFCGHQSA